MTNEIDRFARVKVILGDEGLENLKNSTVMVLGIGGVGSNCAEALARGGVGHLILLDMDVVEPSNINRQAVAYTSTIGRAKVEVMKEIIYEINPDCQVEVHQFELTPENAFDYLSSLPRPDYVIDSIDLVMSKAMVGLWAKESEIPIIAAMGAGNKLDPSRFQVADIQETYNCPLSKMMRREYNKLGVDHIEVVFSDERPKKVKNPVGPERGQRLGTMSYMPPILGMTLAGVVIRRLSGVFGDEISR